jgi:phage major head subunit gpT-like protein
MAITRANITKQLIPGLHEVIGLNYKRVNDEHKAIFTEYSSDRSFEEETLMTGLGEAPIKSEATGVAFDDAQEAWTQRYVHDTVALAFSISEEALEDNLYDTYSRIRAEGLGNSMASTKQQRAADVLNNGFSTFKTGDGVALFSDSHPLMNGGVLDNKDTAELSETSLENATIAISLYTDDRGILINAMPQKLIIPSALQFRAFKILKSDLSTSLGTNVAGTENVTNVNDTNALKGKGYFPGGVHVNHRITDTDSWYIITDCPNGFKYFKRTGLQLAEEGDFTTGNLRVKARERYSFGVSNPRAGYGSDGSA